MGINVCALVMVHALDVAENHFGGIARNPAPVGAASACRMARGTGLAGRPRLEVHAHALFSSSPTMSPVPLTDPFARLLMSWLLCCFYGLL